MKEERETIQEILEITKKRPYPTKETIHLARFVDSCFYVIEKVKNEELRKKNETQRIRREKEFQERIKLEELRKTKELEEAAPSPNQELPPEIKNYGIPTLKELGIADVPSPNVLPKREYVLQIYNNQLGILIEKEKNGKYMYKVVEPYIEDSILKNTQEMYKKEFERDNTLFDNPSFIKRAAEKIANKSNIPFSEMLPSKIKYYLERDILGAGVLDPLLYDEKVKTILCDGPNKAVKIKYDDLGIMPTNINITNNEDITRFIKRLGNVTGKTINEQNPILDINFEGFRFEGTIGIGGGNSKITIWRVK